jgi:hypothetical protein
VYVAPGAVKGGRHRDHPQEDVSYA